jgi:hypothetical protein
MFQWAMKGNGKFVPTRSVRPLNPSRIHSEEEIKKKKVFDELIERRYGHVGGLQTQLVVVYVKHEIILLFCYFPLNFCFVLFANSGCKRSCRIAYLVSDN